jgi:hypothetical protein
MGTQVSSTALRSARHDKTEGSALKPSVIIKKRVA